MALTPNFNLLDGMALNIQSSLLSSAKVILFTNSPVLAEDNVYADFVAPTYTGYADQSCTLSHLTERDDGTLVLESALLFFQPADATNLPLTVYGYAVYQDSSSKPVMFAEYFATPQVLSGAMSSISFVVQLDVPNDDVYGSVALVEI